MAFFPRPVRPSRAVADLWGFLRARRRSDFVFGGMAIMVTGLWFWAIFDKLDVRPEWQPPTVQYVKQWPKNRSTADILAQQEHECRRVYGPRCRADCEGRR